MPTIFSAFSSLSEHLRHRFYIACAGLLLCVVLIAVTVEYAFNQPLKQRFINDHVSYLRQQQTEIIHSVQSAGEATLFLSRSLQQSNLEALVIPTSRSIMQYFMQSYPGFIEATLFDREGHEQVRFNRRQGIIIQAPAESLQSKADRDYMFMRHAYRAGIAYFSQIDLNIEFGVVETPFNEVIRFITPVVNQDNTTIGFLKTKLSSRFFTDRFSQLYEAEPYIDAVVVSKNGYYMMHPEDDKRWAWQLNNPAIKRFHDEYPETWMSAQMINSGSREEGDHLVIFSKFNPYLWNSSPDRNVTVIPMPNTESMLSDGALPESIAILLINKRFFYSMLIGHAPSTWLLIGCFYALLCGLLFYYLKQMDTDLALRHSQQVIQHTQRNLLTNLGHEIRTPLNAMLGVAELLEAESPRQERLIKHMRRSIERFMTLFSNLATAQRIQSDQIFLRQETLRLHDIAEPIRDLFKVATELKTLEFSVDYDHIHGERFIGDRYYLQLLISILLDNAIKFTDQGFVRVSLAVVGPTDARELVIKIEDTGLGMTDEELHVVRHLFVQSHDDLSRHQQGIGSGLWVADQLIKLMEGHFLIASEKAQGTTITVTLPSGVVSEKSLQSSLA